MTEEALVGRLLLQAARQFSGRVCQKLSERNHPGLKSSHALVITTLDRKGARISALAERASVTVQAMGQLVKEMEALGYLERQSDPSDARAVLIMPTAQGHKLLADVEHLIGEIETEQAEKVGHEAFIALRSTLEKMLS